MFNAFAAYLLMPRSSVLSVWDEFSAHSPRLAAVAVAVRFSVSWTAACNQLRNLDLIDPRERERLLENDFRRGELFEFGERFAAELDGVASPACPASVQQFLRGRSPISPVTYLRACRRGSTRAKHGARQPISSSRFPQASVASSTAEAAAASRSVILIS